MSVRDAEQYMMCGPERRKKHGRKIGTRNGDEAQIYITTNSKVSLYAFDIKSPKFHNSNELHRAAT
ncbi:hypothetical protein T265_12200 [Opisthorchis viverrini]|uniref:Uncharacterized protein n=1 Tax=Opisthorchis viverrini TaxID=6198 RepID=A0A074YV96_OPIVI|nr:hypothetical protein T265_12200 [Opisthorchis viverrini]KER18656.1 hypothetical protein T265_12200 [Opisthorchis viverrini]